MVEEIISQICSSEVTIPNALFKLCLSLLLGSIIGLERRHKGQTAGMRTFALITMGATLAMLVSIYIPQEYMGLKNGDPGRIAAQVISGIGFLGAGAIIQMKGSVRGLTTAAGIWIAACIGLGVGAGMYVISSFACFLIIFVLLTLEFLEKHLFKGGEQKIIRLKVHKIITSTASYHDVFKRYHIHISDEFFRYDYTQSTTTVNFMVRCKNNTDFVNFFNALHEMGDVLSLTLTNEVNN